MSNVLYLFAASIIDPIQGFLCGKKWDYRTYLYKDMLSSEQSITKGESDSLWGLGTYPERAKVSGNSLVLDSG